MMSVAIICSCNKKDDDATDDDNIDANQIIATPDVPVTDIDGNTYQTIKIGNQIWMAENLKTTKFRDNTSIIEIANNTSWGDYLIATEGKYCKYNNNSDSGEIYGYLYDGIAAYNSRNIAPTGWRLPTEADWDTLVQYLGGVYVAGGKLKEIGFIHWESPNSGADNLSGFKAVGSGYRNISGVFYAIRQQAYWWVASSSGGGVVRLVNYNGTDIQKGYTNFQWGYSIRCIKE